ncbi:hypothetical protein [Cryptosporangium sp. NPDC051539]|uniref:hypothetical protein n=1 Tax=Cryptosporangium sp. NPDC051539 TaxID=3363962 RepID=UPI00379C4F84
MTHTAFVLTALSDLQERSRRDDVEDALNAGYVWLTEHVVRDQVHDDDARMEGYNVSWEGPDRAAV